MKVSVHEFDKTVAFYRDILGFEVIEASSPDDIDSVTFVNSTHTTHTHKS